MREIYIERLNKNNLEEVVKLFDENFYFMSTYPTKVSLLELETFLLNNSIFTIIQGNKTIGLALIKAFNEKYVFVKLKIHPKYEDNKLKKNVFKNITHNIYINFKNITRLETNIYDFEELDNQFYNSLGMKLEVIKHREIFKNNRFCSCYLYSFVDSEIKLFVEDGLGA